MMRRRSFLQSLGLAMGALTLPGGLSIASGSGASRRFIFVFCQGGWDPTTVFVPKFGHDTIDMEADATLGEVGGLSFVDHPDRPGVRSFMERWHSRMAILNGLNTSTLSHEVGYRYTLTGGSSGDDADWATRIAHPVADQFTAPHLLLTGQGFPGAYGTSICKMGQEGQLAGLLSGAILNNSDLPTKVPNPAADRIIDRYLGRRSAAFAGTLDPRLNPQGPEALERSILQARELKDVQYDMDFSPAPTLSAQLDTGIQSLERGIARVVSMTTSGMNWDTHEDNAQQSGNFETLFGGLADLMTRLEAAQSPDGGALVDDTIVVVLSEFGRTPRLNGSGGRDHWPYTSAMVIGPDLKGDRVYGGVDDLYYGVGVDLTSGDIDTSRPPLTPEHLGASLLALAGLDPFTHYPDAEPIWALLP